MESPTPGAAVFCAPARYTQGPGATQLLGQEMTVLGLEGPVLVIAGRSAEAALADSWRSSFHEAGMEHETLSFRGECSHAEIDRGIAHARKLGARTIVGSGGGKALDAARAVASALSLPVVNCPSLASSDAPCSALSVIYKEDGSFDSYNVYGRNPDLVLVDTQLISNAPPRLLAAGMGDALATMFEAEAAIKSGASNMRGGKSTMTAGVIARTCYQTLLADGVQALAAVKEKRVDDHVERIVEANTLLSGLGFESSGLAAAHAIHDGLTALAPTHDYYHGEKVAFGTIVELVMERQEQSVLDEVLGFANSVGLPVTFAQLGLSDVSDEDLHHVATLAIAPDKTIHNEPFEVNESMVFDAMKEADSVARAFSASR